MTVLPRRMSPSSWAIREASTKLDDRWYETAGGHQHQTLGTQPVGPAHCFGGFETQQDIGGAGRDLRRQHLRTKAQVRRHHAAALRHAGDFGFLDIMAERDRRFGKDLGGGHHPLAAGTDDENVGGVEAARFRHLGGSSPARCPF